MSQTPTKISKQPSPTTSKIYPTVVTTQPQSTSRNQGPHSHRQDEKVVMKHINASSSLQNNTHTSRNPFKQFMEKVYTEPSLPSRQSGIKLLTPTRNPTTPINSHSAVPYRNNSTNPFRQNAKTETIQPSNFDLPITGLVRYLYAKSETVGILFRHTPIYQHKDSLQKDYKYIKMNNEYITQTCDNLGIKVLPNELPPNKFLLSHEGSSLTPFGAMQQMLTLQHEIIKKWHFNPKRKLTYSNM